GVRYCLPDLLWCAALERTGLHLSPAQHLRHGHGAPCLVIQPCDGHLTEFQAAVNCQAKESRRNVQEHRVGFQQARRRVEVSPSNQHLFFQSTKNLLQCWHVGCWRRQMSVVTGRRFYSNRNVVGVNKEISLETPWGFFFV